MAGITRGIIRWTVIGALGVGVLTLVVGPERVAAGFTQTREKAQAMFDRHVDDPTVLRRQLHAMADQYPRRIAEVRGELTEVNQQIAQFERDVEIAGRVVAMTGEDLTRLRDLVARAEAEREQSARPVAIRFEGVRFDLEDAYSEARRINNVRQSYQDRLAHSQQQLSILDQQRARLQQILGKLESDYAAYQNQLWQLDRQIDAIDRNNRLINLTKQLKATLESYDKFAEVGNLKQLEGRLKQLQSIQQAQLDALSRQGVNRNYEDRAVYELEGGDDDNPFDFESDAKPLPQKGEPDAERNGRSERSLAFKGPIVIE